MAPHEVDRDTREQLLRAARDVLLDEGLAGFSLRKVAAQCGISAPAIYRHFEDKDDLLAAAIQRGAALFTNYLLSALSEATPRERLQQLGQRYFRFAVENPRDYELIFVVRCM
ncbi:MAG TPA: helix-turn-helix domain-containing protein, partial [Polyangiaceae bacterium]|nr:helix-turn-helix domain-containing protein [Polyangiaceae bacterium]